MSTRTTTRGTTAREAGEREQKIRVRRDVWKISDEAKDKIWHPTLLWYARAIIDMQRRDSDDKTSWTFQANMHWTYDDPSYTLWNQCPHGNWYFFPWHRMYLRYFERIIRATVDKLGGPADWALPYWDYGRGDQVRALPPAFRQELMPKEKPSDPDVFNPLYLGPGRRSPQLVAGGRVTEYASNSTDCLTARTFDLFGGTRSGPDQSSGAAEQRPHGTMHDAVGGTFNQGERRCDRAVMSKVPCAAQDPIFWLHHCNIDRLWEVWLARHDPARPGEFTNPTGKAWLEARYTFVDETGAKVRNQMPKDYLDISKLGYSYGDMEAELPGRAARPAAAAAAASGDGGRGAEEEPGARWQGAEMAGASEEAIDLVGQDAMLRIAVPRQAMPGLDEAVPAESDARVYLKVENVQATHNPGTAYDVHLAVGGAEPRRVGTITLFGIEAMNELDAPHEGDEGLSFTFDVTELAADMSDADTWDSGDISVRFMPVSLVETAEGEPAREFENPTLTPITVGRARLFVG